MRKVIAAVSAAILGGTLLATPTLANAEGCPNGLKYRVLGPVGTTPPVVRGVYELPDFNNMQTSVGAGAAVKGPGGSVDGATPVTHRWDNGPNQWVKLSSITAPHDVDWMSSLYLEYLGCASA
ncbi:hypothetical protein GCM10029976_047850 [Kribbella albertanoniae]|uniref:Uncharacterized protein n=1 Tax=Kribbella albertanoniae TaxID=1266829 RepID=A0A4V2XQF1_9ACTN|nr:hypothetical protein [Kribbella albertanoniae]TDC25795.1 hypothetical protein E1261_23615 [Kribbella albertanoniae]